MQLSHYCDTDVVALRQRGPREREPYFKPNGLWVSVDGPDDWRAWCLSEEFPLGRRRHAVTLRQGDVGVLLLETEASLLAFTQQYEISPYREISFHKQIDWPRVMQEWAGVIVAPYQWGLRMELWWYYGWDCASGCIWDVERAVERIELVECLLEGETWEAHKAKREEGLKRLRESTSASSGTSGGSPLLSKS